MKPHRLPLLLCLALAMGARADGPADNLPDKVRRVPPPGIKISDSDRAELQKGAEELSQAIEALRPALKGQPALLDVIPDAQIYHKAVSWALRYDEFFKSNEVRTARALLAQGMERARLLAEGSAPWLTATGL